MIPKTRVKKQPENELLRDPLIKHMRSEGWFCKILHSDSMQKGLPDFLAIRNGVFRFIECKLIRNNSVSFTDDQLHDFKEIIHHGQEIYIVCIHPQWDLGEKANKMYLEHCYEKILKPIGQGRIFLSGNYRLLF